jgi:hypothetical protein
MKKNEEEKEIKKKYVWVASEGHDGAVYEHFRYCRTYTGLVYLFISKVKMKIINAV